MQKAIIAAALLTALVAGCDETTTNLFETATSTPRRSS
jgi:hypothetical protein